MNAIFASKGLKRTLASIFAAAVPIFQVVPALAPYAQTVTWIAGLLGLVGVGQAAVAGTLNDMSAPDRTGNGSTSGRFV